MNEFSIKGMLADVHRQRIYPAEIRVVGERIISITEIPENELTGGQFILPGFVDAHVHIESSMLVPSQFARLAVVHGTVATVSDPHEIANVCGIKGIEYMIEEGETVPFKFNFGAPSCVPATKFETSGAIISTEDIIRLMKRKDILYLSEMMNFPGVLNSDHEVLAKLEAANKYKKPVDGHAPGLRAEEARKYINAGISTDHECFTKEEALDKLNYGMKILIREGSAAKNFEALAGLITDYPDDMMFCSDDKHPDSLVKGHINLLCSRAIEKGIDLFKVLKAACLNPVDHYKLKVGVLRPNDFADFIIVKDLRSFSVMKTFINGKLVADKGQSLIPAGGGKKLKSINHFKAVTMKPGDFAIAWKGEKEIPVIEAMDGSLITNRISTPAKIINGFLESDVSADILKIVVVNRYQPQAPAVAFIKNFGLKKGSIASSVAHDSHNIVAVGVDDISICNSVNAIMECCGGISCDKGKQDHEEQKPQVLPLPVAGLMSQEDGYVVAEAYSKLDRAAKDLGSTLSAPFMTLSFMALLVIPHLKLSDKGLFDGDRFSLIN